MQDRGVGCSECVWVLVHYEQTVRLCYPTLYLAMSICACQNENVHTPSVSYAGQGSAATTLPAAAFFASLII